MRITHSTRRVLQVFLDAPRGEVYGFELARASGLPSGTVYPILRRLERGGWITSRWEEIDEHEEGRRRRCYYRLRGDAVVAAKQETRAEREGLRTLNPGWFTP